MAYPTAAMKFPPTLQGMTNGDIDTSYMRVISSDGAMLYRTAAEAFYAMQLAALREGILLQPSSVFDAYRPYKVQERIFLERYKTIWLPFVDKKVWQGKTWYKWSGATAAAPGTSNHGWGLAIDIKDSSGSRLAWLVRNAPTYGFYWEIQDEAWHLRYCLGDDLPDILIFTPPPPYDDEEPTPTPLPQRKKMLTAIRAVGDGAIYLTDGFHKWHVNDGNAFSQMCWIEAVRYNGKDASGQYYQPFEVSPEFVAWLRPGN